MLIEIKAPSPGESINEVLLANWLVADGSYVEKNQEIGVIESEKATLMVVAEISGFVTLLVKEGNTVEVGAVMASITPAEKPGGFETYQGEPEKQNEAVKAPLEQPTAAQNKPGFIDGTEKILRFTPVARKMAEASSLSDKQIIDFFKRQKLNKDDVSYIIKNIDSPMVEDSAPAAGSRNLDRKKMTPLRRKLAERLVSVKNETAMLTTFNEVNMTPIFEIRNKYKDVFLEKKGIGLGFMSFFARATAIALNHFPQVNSQIDGDKIVSFDFVDISIAVSTPKGLVVPVIRNAHLLNLTQLEMAIKELAIKGRDNKLSLEEMQGGTFTITNGGVFGSMLSTPIINPPQSAILGMHNIVERPIAVNGKVEIHPVMYVALSYDHRIIDGRESVGFLVKVKEMLENPSKMLFGAKDPIEVLLGL